MGRFRCFLDDGNAFVSLLVMFTICTWAEKDTVHSTCYVIVEQGVILFVFGFHEPLQRLC